MDVFVVPTIGLTQCQYSILASANIQRERQLWLRLAST